MTDHDEEARRVRRKEVRRIAEGIKSRQETADEIIDRLDHVDEVTLSELMFHFGQSDQAYYRDVIRSALDRGLITRQIETMERLDRAASKIAVSSVAIAVVAVLVAVAQLVTG